MLQKSHWMKQNSQMELYRKPTFVKDQINVSISNDDESNQIGHGAFRVLNYVSNIKK